MTDRTILVTGVTRPALFAQVRLEFGAVVWPGDIDLAPDAMCDAIKTHGRWIPE
jgi:hypothetical protein